MKMILLVLFLFSSIQACMTPRDREIYAEVFGEPEVEDSTEVLAESEKALTPDELKNSDKKPQHADAQIQKAN